MANLNINAAEAMVRQRGHKMTPQRRAIIEYLQTSEKHPTTEEVLMAVNSKFPMTSRATVYNTINWLKEAGLLQEIFDDDCVRLDPNLDRHHHFICRKCGKIEDIGFDLVSDLGICTMPKYQTIETFEVVLRGVCANCQK